MELKARTIQRLIDLMLWNIGRDIECDGNLLLLFGFTRHRPSAPESGSSRYHIFFEGYEVVLWGFGMMVIDHHDDISIFINRHRYAPKIVVLDDAYHQPVNYSTPISMYITNVWSLSDLHTREPRYDEYDTVRRLILILFKLLYKYELWLNTIKEREYRAYCMKRFGIDDSVEDVILMLRSLCEFPIKIGKS
ncbi:MAG: hypothetical protein QW572_08315 [Candidatus Nitrosocaldus sp.]